MALDTDIQAAADSLTLEKIKTQDWRAHLKYVRDNDTTRLTTYVQQVDAAEKLVQVQEQVAEGLLNPEQELRLAIVKAIAANYMKPTTGTLPETIANDVKNDANRLHAAVTAVEKIVMGTFAASPDA